MDSFLNFFTEPLLAPYVQKALVEIVILSVIVAVVGTYVVLKGLSFLSLALSHAIFPGVVVAYLIGSSYLLLSLVIGVGVSLLIGLAKRNVRVGHDSAIGTIYTGSFAAGIMLVSYTRLNKQLSEFLFGRLFGVGWDDIIITASIGGLVLLLLGLARKEVLLISFDANMAQAQGLPVAWLEIGFLAILSMVVVVALPAVGNIQIVALLVTPPATARLLTDRLNRMMLISGVVAFVSGVVGIYLAVHLNLVPGATVLVVLTGLFLLVYLFSPKYGLLAGYLAHYRD
ncbi:MAG: metal ABC transporter permease [Chloroflexi bacterium]|nr:metal ABC transporter permease [Chloroflexota bacterium]